jgi:hypothetical protein
VDKPDGIFHDLLDVFRFGIYFHKKNQANRPGDIV